MESKTQWEGVESALCTSTSNRRPIRTRNLVSFHLVLTSTTPDDAKLDFQSARCSKKGSVRIFSSSANSGSTGGK